MNKFSIGNYTASQLFTGRWEVKRGDMVMGIFGTRKEAYQYCEMKDNQEQQAA